MPRNIQDVLKIHQSFNTKTKSDIRNVVNNFFENMYSSGMIRRESIRSINIDFKTMSVQVTSTDSKLFKKIEFYLIAFSRGEMQFASPFSHVEFFELTPIEFTILMRIFKIISKALRGNALRYHFLTIENFENQLEQKDQEIQRLLEQIQDRYHFLIQTAHNQYLRFMIEKPNVTLKYFEKFIALPLLRSRPDLSFDINYHDSGFNILSYCVYHFYITSTMKQSALELKGIISKILSLPSVDDTWNIYGEKLYQLSEKLADHKNRHHCEITFMILRFTLLHSLSSLKGMTVQF